MFPRIDHIGIVVADLSQSLGWYAGTLGWVVHREDYISDVGAKLAYLLPRSTGFPTDATSLQIVQPIEPSAVLDHLHTKGEGLHHVCFEVNDISRAVRSLGADPDRVFMGGRGQLACFLERSPEGVLIELTERLPHRTPT